MGRDTQALLREFREQGSEGAFQELVNRYINLVYSVACRRVGGDTHLAEDVVQMVFTDLARKARSLAPDIMLGGWLHHHTCFVASTIMRTNRRRLERERQAVSMNTLTNTADAEWEEIAPVLDEVIDQLPELDRSAILMRFFEHRDLRAIGEALGASDDAAQKRVSRALEKVRELLIKRGISVAVPALTALLTSNFVSAAPAVVFAGLGKRALEQAAIPVGLLTGLFGWLTPTVLKTALISIALLGLLSSLFLLPRFTPRQAIKEASIQALEGTSPGAPNPALQNDVERSVPAEPLMTNGLRLLILAADSGKPIPNVPVSVRVWEAEFSRRPTIANREGICNIPLNRDTITQLEITTRVDGFADTRLHWRPDRGEEIPESYTLRLSRPAQIGGRVLDPDGQPVAGAKVGWNHEEDPTSKTAPESHEFGWIEVPTDADGRWRINRIAPGMLRRLYGGARHAEHAGTRLIFVGREPQTADALRAETHVFTLGRATTVTGVVVDAEERPIAGAKVMVGGVGNADRREGTTVGDGTFVLIGCVPGETTLSAEAQGYANTTLNVMLTTNSQSFRVQLKAGRQLTLRVVDKAGAPVPRARFWLNTFNHGIRRSANKPPQIDFVRYADTNGILVWNGAPEGELTFQASCRGYMESSDVNVRADESEKTIVLQSALEVFGKVQDETGQPIQRFRLICGWPERDGLGRIVGTRWSTLERFWLNFSGGQFRHVLEEPIVVGTTYPGFAFKIEAEGYTPFVSRPIEPDEGKVRLDVALRRAAATVVTVLLPNGQPAANADVGLVSADSLIEIIPGGLSRTHPENLTSLLRTDRQGGFSFTAEPGCARVIAAHADGYAEALPAALLEEAVIQLRPWAQIKGNYKINDKPAGSRKLWVNLAHGDHTTFKCSRSFQTLTDAQGQFTFAKVPHGRLKLIELVPDRADAPTAWAHQILKEVEVQPGEIIDLNLGGKAYRVSARLIYPDHLELPEGTTTHFFLFPHEGDTRVYPLSPNPDGTWTVNEVAPGKYFFKVNVVHMPTPGVPKFPASGRSTAVIDIPAEAPETPIDFGEIIIGKAE